LASAAALPTVLSQLSAREGCETTQCATLQAGSTRSHNTVPHTFQPNQFHTTRSTPSPTTSLMPRCGGIASPCGDVRCASGPLFDRTECPTGPVARTQTRAPQTATRDVPRRKRPHSPKPVPCHARDRFPLPSVGRAPR